MLFTLFTPVFNRRHTISRVWESIQNQTFRDFEWIIVDDGSTDGVGPLLDQYKIEADFPITILTQPNSGKHVAWNRAVAVARGDLFIPCDSDDAFTADTLERFKAHWESIQENERNGFSGINVICVDFEKGQTVGDLYPRSPMISNNLELHYIYRISGEKWGCIRTDILRSCLFPEIPGCRYFPESYLWFSIAKKYKVLCVNEALRMYEQGRIDSLSRSEPNYEMLYRYNTWIISNTIRYMRFNIKELAWRIHCQWKFGWKLGKPLTTIVKDVSCLTGQLILICALGPSLLFQFIRERH